MKRKRHERDQKPRKKQQAESSNLKSREVYDDTLLKLYYNDVSTLHTALQDRLPLTSRSRIRRLEQFDTEFPEHSGFLKSVVIGARNAPSREIQNVRRQDLVNFTQTQRLTRGNSRHQHACNLSEIVDFAIWSLFRKESSALKAPAHVLCHGYQRTGITSDYHHPNQNLPLPGIVERTSNNNVASLKKAPWTQVASVLGKDAELIMLNLLLDCGIFRRLSTGKQNLYQLSGEPISRMAPLAAGNELHAGRREGSSQCRSIVTKPGSIKIPRNRILYARPSMNNHGMVQLGLKHIHALNRYNDLTAPAQDVRIMLYVFPRQFGLHNVFTSRPNSEMMAQPLQDYTLREQEISALSQEKLLSVPRRLRGQAMTLVRKLRKNHQRCSYSQLVRHYCPVVPQYQQQSHLLGEGIQSRNTSSNPRLISTQLQSSSKTPDQSQPLVSTCSTSLLPYATAVHCVVAFCQAIIFRLLPRNSFGLGKDGDHNRKLMEQAIRRFIEVRRYETITLHEICQNMRVTCIDWLSPPRLDPKAKLSMTDHKKRLELLYEIVYYVFDSILVPLIRSNFYVTETGVHRNRLYYFRHDVWKRLMEPNLAVMKLTMFRPLHTRHLKYSLSNHTLGCSQMRLLPKEQGVRPIMNLRRKQTRIVNGKTVLGKSVNAMLTPVFSVLNLERHRQPEVLGSAMFSVRDIHDRLKQFKAKLGPCLQTFYFVKVDIRSCFDTIPQEGLVSFIDGLLRDQMYQVAGHVEMKRVSGSTSHGGDRAVSKYTSRAVALDGSTLMDFDIANDLAKNKRRHVFVGGDHERTLKLSYLRSVLNSHIRNNIVRIGRKHFQQVQGIAQGSVLSSLLCNLFYGGFERQELGFLNPSESLLLRLIDDFLLITTNEEHAKHFVHAMARGNLRHGISVNADKSLVNFEISIDGHKIPRMYGAGDFPYCGITINTRNLHLRKDGRTKDVHVENGLSIAGIRAGHHLEGKILSSVKRQLQVMLLDETLNSRAQILQFIFQTFAETGMRMHRYVKNLPKPKRPSQSLLIRLCDQLIKLGHKLLDSSDRHDQIRLPKTQTSWIVAASLIRVLQRKQSEYGPVLDWLRDLERDARHSMGMAAKELEQIASHGVNSLVDYVY